MKLLYQAHVLPIVDYCDVVWVPTNVSYLKRLERFHSQFDSTSSVFNFTLGERRRFHTTTQIAIQNSKQVATSLFTSYLQICCICGTGRTGRNVHRLYVPAVHLNYGKRSFWCDHLEQSACLSH